MDGVVFQELRESRGLAYSAAAHYNTPSKKNEPEYSYTYIITQNDKMMDCVKVFNEIINNIPQSEGAFDLAKQALSKRIAAGRITKANIIVAYLQRPKTRSDEDVRRYVPETLPSITLDDIVKFEKENMAKKPWRYIILGDEKEPRHEGSGEDSTRAPRLHRRDFRILRSRQANDKTSDKEMLIAGNCP